MKKIAIALATNMRRTIQAKMSITDRSFFRAAASTRPQPRAEPPAVAPRRVAAVVLAAPGSELDGWLRKGRTRAAIVRPDRAVMQAGRNIQAICDAMPTFTAVHGGAVEVEG